MRDVEVFGEARRTGHVMATGLFEQQGEGERWQYNKEVTSVTKRFVCVADQISAIRQGPVPHEVLAMDFCGLSECAQDQSGSLCGYSQKRKRVDCSCLF
jgi:hypothetical protein